MICHRHKAKVYGVRRFIALCRSIHIDAGTVPDVVSES